MKGVAIVWVEILAGIFVIGLLYAIFSDVIYGWITPAIFPHLSAIDPVTSGVNTTAMFATWNIINMVWYVFPIILIFALLLYGVIRSQEKEYETGVY